MKALELGYPNKDIRENYLKALEYRYPEWIPCSVNFLPGVWKKYREKLEEEDEGTTATNES